MTQTTNRFLDEFSKLMTDAAGAADGLRKEAEQLFKSQGERFLREMDVVRREEFEAVKAMAAAARNEVAALRAEIVAMRERVRSAHRTRDGQFDVKHSPGGMVDAEFAVQYLVLANSASHPELVGNVGNIALLLHAEQAGLLPTGVGQAAGSAYRELRRIQHQARLDEQPTQVPQKDLAAQSTAILTLWRAVFGQTA